jgi:phosphate acetyltransferase
MTNTIYITSSEPYSGKSVITLGLVNMLLGKVQKIGYFKPIINTNSLNKKDIHIQTVLAHFNLPVKYEDAYAFSLQQAMDYYENGTEGEMIDAIISKFKKLEDNYDFTVLEGSDFIGEGTAYELNMNALIAKNLCSPVLLVVSGENKTVLQIVHEALNLSRNFKDQDVQVLGVIANKVDESIVNEVHESLNEFFTDGSMLTVIPVDKELRNPTIKEICEDLKGKLLFGSEHLANQVDNYVTGAMQLPNFLSYLKENVLIVTPGDRGDIIIGSLQANSSASYPKVAGIVLTADILPDKPVMRLIEGLNNVVPIIAVKTGTFETINAIGAVKSRITADNLPKIDRAINFFNKYVDVSSLDKNMATYQSDVITPHMFQYQLIKSARRQIQNIVLPEGEEERILKAVARLIAQEIVTITLLGKREGLVDSIKRLGLTIDMSKVTIIDPVNADCYEDYVETLYGLRKGKHLTLEMAREQMSDVSCFGTMMVYKGHADGMVSGAVHTTQHTIRPALQFIKTRPGISIVSSVFFMCLADRVCVYGDCAVNPNPTAEQLAEIAISSADTGSNFGIEPRIAMLSYSSGTSGIGEEVEKVRQATRLVKELRPDLKVEGPIQYDAAVDPVIGKQKMPGSAVAGKATILIFPDLNTGNNTYKAVQRETGALAIGPVLQGLKKPVNDLSRGCTVEDIFNTVAITSIQSQEVYEPQTLPA